MHPLATTPRFRKLLCTTSIYCPIAASIPTLATAPIFRSDSCFQVRHLGIADHSEKGREAATQVLLIVAIYICN